MTGGAKVFIIQCEVKWIEGIPIFVNYVINQPITGIGNSMHFENYESLSLIILYPGSEKVVFRIQRR